jgi:hypothetical protein
MAPPATATARRSTARAQPRPAPSGPKRPPLRIFEPAPRRRPGIRLVRRPTMWISGILVVGSLLAVVAGDAMLAQGQVRLSTTQAEVTAAVSAQKTLQSAVAEMSAPTRVVYQAENQLGMVAPAQVVDLPEVPLDVPLPTPQTAPLPGAAPGGSAAAAGATTPVSTGTAGSTSATTTPATR